MKTRMHMRKWMMGLVGALVLGVGTMVTGAAQAAPVGLSKQLNAGASAIDLVQQARYYRGTRYCFYFDAWRGAGWYRCGYASRRGHGWNNGRVYRAPAYRHAPQQHYRRQERQPIAD